MVEHDLLEAFNDCVDRLNAGETLENCLSDYPEFAERLRPLLGAGQLVSLAHAVPDAEMASDRQQIRQMVLAQAKASSPKPYSSSLRFGFSLALVAVVGIVVASVVLMAMVGPAVGNIFSNLTKNLIPNYSGSVALNATLPAVSLPSATPQIDATFAPSASPQPTATPPVPGIVATSVAMSTFDAHPLVGESTLNPLAPSVDDVPLTATALGILLVPAEGTPTPNFALPTALVGATMPPMSMTPFPISTSLPDSGGLPAITPLNAGEIDDNGDWDTYMQYRSNYLERFGASVHNVEVSDRQIITVTDPQGLPLLGARVLVFVGQTLLSDTRTYANGQTLFFPYAYPQGQRAQSYNVQVEYNGMAVQFNLNPTQGSLWRVVLDGSAPLPSPTKLDVLFLLDATGSMSDEIAQLQNNLLGISARIAQLSANNVDARYGLVTYRDRGDAYIAQATDFVPDVNVFQAVLNQVQAGGGGDTPESLNEALHDAVQGVSWRGEDTIKLIFLVADAPPHLDYPNDYNYAQEMMVAGQRGIKIHPIASSGLSPDGEFIFRQLAQTTMGHFLFLTYAQGASGVTGDSRPDLQVGEPSNPNNQEQGDYTVERLDELVVRLITDEIASLSKPAAWEGVVAQLTATSIYPAVSAPLPQSTTPTPTPIPVGQSSFLPPRTTQGTSLLPESTRTTLFVVLLGLVVVAAFLIGSLTTKLTPRPKRKNEEIIEPEN